MVGIIEADAEELADRADAGPEPRIAVDERQRRGIERGESGEALRRQSGAGDVADVR